MLIELDDRIGNVLEKISNVNDTEAFILDKLFELMYEGKQIIYASRYLFKNLLSCKYLNVRSKQLIDYILNHYNEIYNACYFKVKYKTIIYPKSCNIEKKDDCFYLPLENASDISTSILSTENPTDFDFYINISKFIENSENNPVITFSLNNCAYGGGSAEQFLKSMHKPGVILFAIADSDKKFNDDQLGNTAKIVKNYIDTNCDTMVYHILNFIEKENLVPLDFYIAIAQNDKQELLKCIRGFYKNDEFMRYYDIKEGVKLKRLKENNNKWNNLYLPFLDECKKAGIYNMNATSDEDKVVSGIGNKLANITIDSILNPKSTQKISKAQKNNINILKSDIFSHIPDYIMNEWETIYKYIFDFGCVLKQHHNSFVS